MEVAVVLSLPIWGKGCPALSGFHGTKTNTLALKALTAAARR
jgi:hypothetical protein